jgi:hypothetical protein
MREAVLSPISRSGLPAGRRLAKREWPRPVSESWEGSGHPVDAGSWATASCLETTATHCLDLIWRADVSGRAELRSVPGFPPDVAGTVSLSVPEQIEVPPDSRAWRIFAFSVPSRKGCLALVIRLFPVTPTHAPILATLRLFRQQ